MFRLIALDLDGTLIGRDLSISPRSKAAISQALAAGVKVTLATGRMFQASLPFAQELNISTPIICYQGAMIGDPITKEILWHRPVSLSLARQVIKVVKETHLHLNVYLDDELYVERLTKEAELYARMSRVQVHPVGNLLAFLDRDPTKLVIIGEESETDQIMDQLNTEFGSVLYITKSYPRFCEVAHPECSKGKALAQLATQLGIAQAETVAIGDNPNDLDMVTWAGLGVAMANASPEVTAAADWVTASLEEDGAAQAVERLFEITSGV